MSVKVLGPFALAMISVSAILNLRGLPLTAAVGSQAVIFYAIAAIGFLLPSSLACAELATHQKTNGGVYSWVRAAFGESFGFLAIWMEWINNVIAFPATLATIVATLSYLSMPMLVDPAHRWVFFSVMLGILWFLTFFNCLGIQISSRLNIVGALFGTILPGLFMIILGLYWWVTHHPIAFNAPTAPQGWPHFDFTSLALGVAVLSAYSGMQVTAFHANNVKNPKQSFPKAIALAFVLIVCLSIGASLSMSAIVPPTEINLINGVIQIFNAFFKAIHCSFLTFVFAGLIALGSLASLSAWMLGPARGLLVAAQSGHLPRWCAKANQYEMPARILCVQGVIASILLTTFVWMPSIKSAFWMLIALTSQFTVLMYVLVFAALVVQRIRRGNDGGGFRIPGGLFGVFVVAGLGIISCLAGFIVGLFPPSNIGVQQVGHYVGMMVLIDTFILVFPWLPSRLAHLIGGRKKSCLHDIH